jgi:hypothetical protein
VMRADLTGANPTVLAGSQPNVTSLHTDGGQLFWTTNAAVLVLDQASGNSPTSLATGRNSPQSVSADSTHVYWIEGTWANPDNTIVRMPRGGGAVQNVTAVGAADVFSIALDTRDVYAAGSSGGTIWRVSKTGGSPEFLATGLSYPFFIAVDATDIYFTSETTAQVFRLAK